MAMLLVTQALGVSPGPICGRERCTTMSVSQIQYVSKDNINTVQRTVWQVTNLCFQFAEKVRRFQFGSEHTVSMLMRFKHTTFTPV